MFINKLYNTIRVDSKKVLFVAICSVVGTLNSVLLRMCIHVFCNLYIHCDIKYCLPPIFFPQLQFIFAIYATSSCVVFPMGGEPYGPPLRSASPAPGGTPGPPVGLVGSLLTPHGGGRCRAPEGGRGPPVGPEGGWWREKPCRELSGPWFPTGGRWRMTGVHRGPCAK